MNGKSHLQWILFRFRILQQYSEDYLYIMYRFLYIESMSNVSTLDYALSEKSYRNVQSFVVVSVFFRRVNWRSSLMAIANNGQDCLEEMVTFIREFLAVVAIFCSSMDFVTMAFQLTFSSVILSSQSLEYLIDIL